MDSDKDDIMEYLYGGSWRRVEKSVRNALSHKIVLLFEVESLDTVYDIADMVTSAILWGDD